MSNKTIALIAIIAAMAVIAAVAAYGLTGNNNNVNDSSVTLDASSISLDTGDTRTLIATVTPSGWSGTVSWSSSDTSVATVDSSGKVTAIAAGTVTITATADSSKATCKVTVTDSSVPTTSISLSRTSLSLAVGDVYTLAATVEPSDATDSLTWKSSDTSIATVSSGKVTAVAAGTATITATSGSYSATCKVTVAAPAATSVTVDTSSVTLAVGGTTTLTATVLPSTADQSVTWKSSNTSVATVSSSGKVTAVAAGTAKITATSGSVSGTCAVTVSTSEVKTTSITLSSSTLSIETGETATLTATVKPTSSTQSVTWKSSNTSVAAVSSGKVTGIAAGTATITATSGSYSATCNVTVSSGSSSSTASIDGLTVTCESGTSDIVTYTKDSSTGEYTVTFGAIAEDTEYTIVGDLAGNIVIDVDESETYNFILNLGGVDIESAYESPIAILSGNNVDISATKGTTNTVTDSRSAVDSDEEGVYSAAIHSKVDLQLKGKGSLTVTSENNNGIHSTNDLDVKNLTLKVSSIDNALKGNDSVTITSGTITLYARQGDGIKTTDSDTKTDSDGNTTQRGIVTINSDDGDSVVAIYAACDGIDAAYDVVIEETESNSVTLKICTDAYYSGAESVYSTSEDLYLKVPSSLYSSSYTYYAQFSDGSSTDWVKATYLRATSSGGFGFNSTCYYFTLDKPSDATSVKLYIYSGTPSSEAASGYKCCSDKCTLSSAKDMLVLSSSGSSTISISLGSYSTSSSSSFGPGMGGMQEGNTNKTSYSAKGIKAANAITISSGTIDVSAGDDALHANHDEAIEASTADPYGYGTGNITISGGDLTLISNDDGVHADGTLTISGGNVTVEKSYEGLEGGAINISGGTISITSSDDGINGTATTNEDKGYVTQMYGYVKISGGYIYMVAGGDGLDSNCTSSGGLTITGGKIVIISTSSGNSAIDTDATYKYSGGYVFATCPQGMTQEMTHVSGGSYKAGTSSLSTSTYVTVKFGSAETLVVKMPVSISNAYLFALYSSQPSISTSTSNSYTLDDNGVYWSA